MAGVTEAAKTYCDRGGRNAYIKTQGNCMVRNNSGNVNIFASTDTQQH